MGEALSSRRRCRYHCCRYRRHHMSGWVRTRRGRGAIVVVACGGRKGEAGMKTCAMGTGMSAGQQGRTRTHTRAIPVT